ncbi:heterokaryon incompatibility protein-domain-containing protein [Rhexocercosporidium sp. MPI-PUGE-AT-0058]|nr:heterokaryon incompatibility protein-domain-containing protein [Rhexocercosporidium sp. MPI-PUGE-AT-0058]
MLVEQGVQHHVRLVEPRSATKRYAALSHCWGQFKQLRTDKENFEKHKEFLSLTELPRTFQDAVIVAKNLDIEYLWIDSLCIIQDCSGDWERECSRMASVYSGALVTIAASDAEDSSKGFFHDYSTKFDSSADRQPSRAPIAFQYWCDIVSTYSGCKLTNHTDKLPALSGLAQVFSEVLGDTYVAGLWRNDIHVGLTWVNPTRLQRYKYGDSIAIL